MLLLELLKLFSTNFDINEERFVDIIESNNIKLSQRLLVAIKDDKKVANSITNSNTNSITNGNTNSNSTPISEPIINNSNDDSDTNLKKKKESSGRGRGRPKKTKEINEEEGVIMEVEVITLGDKEYYKTNENVILNKNMEIEGILKNGKITKQSI
jgi:hypothetical protein